MLQSLFLLASLLADASLAADIFTSRAFAEVMPGSVPKQVILYYQPEQEASTKAMKELTAVKEGLEGKVDLDFVKVDGAKHETDMTAAGFDTKKGFPFLFVCVHDSELWKGPIEAAAIMEYITKEAKPIDESWVLRFSSEDELWDTIQPERPALVKFYEEWCGHCKRLKTHFQRSAAHFEEKVAHIDVECSSSDGAKAFCESQDVSGFPLMRLYTEDGDIHEYQGQRKLPDIVSFLNKHLSVKKEL